MRRDEGVGLNARLCEVVQGVEFTVAEQDELIRVLILRDALEAHFGAGEEPDSWLHAYQRHADAIDCAAADRYRLNHKQGVVVLRGDRPQDFMTYQRVWAEQALDSA